MIVILVLVWSHNKNKNDRKILLEADGTPGTLVHYPTMNEDKKEDFQFEQVVPFPPKPKAMPGPDPADVSEFIRNVSMTIK